MAFGGFVEAHSQQMFSAPLFGALLLRSSGDPITDLCDQPLRPAPSRNQPSSPLRRYTNRIKPSADKYLCMSLATEMTRGRSIRRFQIPFKNGKLRVAALNHKPMNRIGGHDTADLALEFT